MMMVAIVLAAAFVLVVLPQIWIFRVMDRHAIERMDIPLTGGAFARDALDRLSLSHVKVEPTELGNHYDPEAKAVRLEPRLLNGRSLSGIVVAAHEVGHAMQDAMNLPMFVRRSRIARTTQLFHMLADGLFFASMLLSFVGKAPLAFALGAFAAIGVRLLSVTSLVVTLPVEFDASFTRALPLLQAGNYLTATDMLPARQLLRAAAYTYISALIRSLIPIPGLGRVAR